MGLFVHAPIAPTKECIALLEELDAPVVYIVLPTTLFEHKIFVGPFQRRYPDAEVWIAPDQWSWPVNLPPQFFGIFKTGTLGVDPAPFDDEFEYELLQPPALGRVVDPSVRPIHVQYPIRSFLLLSSTRGQSHSFITLLSST